jgi:putative ABC transport system ATP-binding protein
METLLKAHELSKSFYQGSTEISVLKSVDFNILPGESLAIIGKSGSGKSTLLSLLAGLDRPDRGDLLFEGKSYLSFSEEELTVFRGQRMGIIFQQFHLLSHLSALENVALAKEILGQPDAHARAQEALDKVGLGHRLHHLPLKLSGGEKQRVAIARAMAVNPSLLLADEPSGSLDEKTGQEVMDLLFSLVRESKMALILVTHNTELAKKCDRALMLDDGRLRECTL